MTKIINIRTGTWEDIPEIMRIHRELGDHQGMSDREMLSFEELKRDGFESLPPYFNCLVAENAQQKVVGYALYFFTYGISAGRSLHLEDLVTSSKYRGQGIGTKLLKNVAEICHEKNLARINLEVIDGNTSAMNFYEKYKGYNSTQVDQWMAFYFETDTIKELGESYNSLKSKYKVREAQLRDCALIASYIKEMKGFQNLTLEDLARDGFTERNPYFHCIVAEEIKDGTTVVTGYALYYHTYSTFDGKRIHLEYLYVHPTNRNKGIATLLMTKLFNIAATGDFVYLTFECLESDPTIKFFEKLDAINYTTVEGWHTYRLLEDSLQLLRQLN